MSFVNNSDHIWEFLGNENEWQDLGDSDQDDLIIDYFSKDYIEFQKIKLKRDAGILSKMILIDQHGKVCARKQYLPLLNKKIRRRRKSFHELGDTPSSTSSEDEFGLAAHAGSINFSQHEFEEGNVEEECEIKVLTPTNKHIATEESKGGFSDNSVEDSIADECILQHGHSEEKHPDNNLKFTDEAQNMMIY